MRPSYYHSPRFRSVAFEEPFREEERQSNYQSELHNNLPYQTQDQTQTQTCTYKDQLGMEVYNSLPKPYVRNQQRDFSNQTDYQPGLYGHQNQYQHQQAPRILVNDRSSPYPTSTVHKSMLNISRSPVYYNPVIGGSPCGDNQAPNYSRLISPTTVATTSSGSYGSESASGNGVVQGGQQVAPRMMPIESIAYKPNRKSAGSSSSRPDRCEEAREFLHRTLPSSNEFEQRLARANQGPQQREPVRLFQLPHLSRLPQQHDSNLVVPDTKRDEYMWDRQLERVCVRTQTYRTLPIVQPRPKARHDLAAGNYMRLNQDPSWEVARSRSSSVASKDYESKIELAIKRSAGLDANSGVSSW